MEIIIKIVIPDNATVKVETKKGVNTSVKRSDSLTHKVSRMLPNETIQIIRGEKGYKSIQSIVSNVRKKYNIGFKCKNFPNKVVVTRI